MAKRYEFKQECKELLLRLLEHDSPSGCEGEATRFFADIARPYCDEIRHDAIGNVVAVINPESEDRIMISAHADEIGFQITSVTPEGMLRFRAIGGVDAIAVCGQRVRLLSSTGEKVTGIVARNRALANFDRNGDPCVKISEMWIDIGAKTRDEALRKIEVGDWGVFKSETCFLNHNAISAKALDNKVGLFVILEALRLISEHRHKTGIYVVATAQEEIGLRGMAVAAQAIRPRIGLVVDVAHATDIPGGDVACYGGLSLGAGPAFTRNADNSPVLVAALRKMATETGIPHQIIVGKNSTGGTDASRLQLFGGDAMVADLSIPCRNVHSPTECCDLRDIASAIELVAALVLSQLK